MPWVATYRLQLTPTFGLADAAVIVPYLKSIGISHVYTSSYLQAAPGSNHGYDVVDWSAVNEELGGEEALSRFHEALRTHEMGHVVDVVPNHMWVGGSQNRLWWDVLKRGSCSDFARYFDIDWNPPEPKLAGKVLLPVLGGTYAHELASGSLAVVRGHDGPEVRYAEHRWPIDPSTLTAEQAASLERFDDHTLLRELLERQHYRLASWTVGRHELNYRRFFEVNTLAGVRVEDPLVFASVHQRTLKWCSEGHVQGLRIDHPDGLRDPGGYLHQLRHAAPDAWIVVEKILERGESLPDDWPVAGTTGYDFIQNVNAVFVSPAAETAMTVAYEQFAEHTQTFEDVQRECKAYAVGDLLSTEVSRLTHLTAGIAERSARWRDVSRRTLQRAIEAVLVATPVYRTYVVDGQTTAVDAEIISRTIAAARLAEPVIGGSVFDFLAALWSGDLDDAEAGDFVARLQQLSGPAMAKGVEDTAFYRYHRLLSLNEVGSDPGQFGTDVAAFHEAMVKAAINAPMSMIASSTHDTKRSEDVRARISLLAEIPDAWSAEVFRWRDHNRSKWSGSVCDHNIEYMIYQTLVGAHPLPLERCIAFVRKAMREAKQHTSWLNPQQDYETAVEDFVTGMFEDDAYCAMLSDFVAPLIVPTRISSLAQTLIKATAPGVPDFYQGTELWTASLVDPDNRTAVDYELRQRCAAQRQAVGTTMEFPKDLADDIDGAAKLGLISTCLSVRRRFPRAFSESAGYIPLALDSASETLGLAFMRGEEVITVAPVRPLHVCRQGWGDTTLTLPPGRWRNVLHPGHEAVGQILLDEMGGEERIVLLVKEETR